MNWNLFATIAAQIQQPLVASADQVSGNIINGIRAPLQAAAVIYIALVGWRIISGQINEPMRDVWGRLGRVAIVAAMLTVAAYNEYVTNLFLHGAADMVTNWISGGNAAAVSAASFDKIWNTAFAGGLAVLKNLSIWSVVDWVVAAVVLTYWCAAATSAALCFLIWMVAQVLLALLVAIGPLLVVAILFPATRSLFERWIGALISCLLLQIMAVVLVTVLIGAETAMLADIAVPGDPVAQLQVLMSAVILFAIAGLVLSQLPGAATAVAGGLHFHAGVLSRATYGQALEHSRAGIARLGTASRSGASHALTAVRSRLPPGIPLSTRK